MSSEEFDKYIITVFLPVFLFVTLLLNCTRHEHAVDSLSEQFTAMGGVPVDVVVYATKKKDFDSDIQACRQEVKRLERILSSHIDDSELNKLNRLPSGETFRAGPELAAVLRISEDVFNRTGGAFDPTAGPLISLWRKAAEEDKLPAAGLIAKTQKQTGFNSVTLDEGNVTITSDITIDLGGVAKGYIVDKLVEMLQERGVQTGIVNAGGDLRVFGKKKGGFSVGIRDPESLDPNDIIGSVRVKQGAVVSSGSYERFSIIEGRKISHIIDPRTGQPVKNDLVSVSVFADSAAVADGIATGLFVLGFSRAKRFLIDEPKIGGFLITSDKATWVDLTEGFSQYEHK